MYCLEIISGESPLRNVHIEDEVIVIGSLPHCDIQLEGDEIADKHLALEMKKGKMRIYDLVKSDLLMLNGVTIREADIGDGDVIDLGVYRLKLLLNQARGTTSVQPIGEDRPMGPMHIASLCAVGLMLSLQLVFIFFVSMRWRHSEIREEVIPQIRLAQGTPTAPATPSAKPTPPTAPPTEKPKPAVTKPAATPPERVKPPQPKTVVSQPAVPKPVAPKPPASASAVTKPERPSPDVQKPVKAQPRTLTVNIPEPVVTKSVPPQPEVRKPAEAKPREPFPTTPVPVVTKPTPRPPPAPVTPTSPVVPKPVAPQPAPDPLAMEKTMLAEARGLMKKLDWNGADRVLQRLQIINPKFMDAYAERARVFEARRMFAEAVSQWEIIIARGPRHADFSEAVRSRDRLTGKIEQAGILPPRANKIEPVDLTERKISIGAVEIQRYDKNERFDEMRLLTIVLQPRSASQRLAGADITVEVSFFDQDVKSGRIESTKALVPESLFQLSGRIRLSEPPTLNAAYVVPKGFRKKQQQTLNRDMRFYGYIIQIYYKGVLQHQIAKPNSLLSAAP